MADVDLFREAYRSKLGRDASDDELQGWVSGSYGGGSVQDRLNQIANSGEAQAYRPPQRSQGDGSVVGQNPDVSRPQTPDTPTPAFTPLTGFPQQNNQTGNYWDFNNADTQRQISDWYNQYLGRTPGFDDYLAHQRNPGGLSGIHDVIRGSHEAERYRATRPTPPTPPTGTGTTDGATVAGPQNGNFESWFAQLTGGKPPTPESLESLAPILAQHGIRIGSKGNRGWSDTIILPDGRMFDVIEAAGIGTGKRWVFQPVGAGGAPSGMPGTQFNDPHTQYLEKLLQQMIQSRMSPVNDPSRMMYEQAMKDRATALGQGNQQLDQLMGYLQTRFQELQGNGYTSAEGEAIRTGALDPIENDRQAARKRVMERLSARGLTPDSGIAQQALLEVDKAFDAMRGTTQTALTTHDLNRREDRKQRAQTIGTQLVDIPQARAREQLDVFGALNQLSQLARQENEAREREAVGYGGALADLGPQRLQLAMQAAGMGGNPSSMFGNLMQLAGLNQNAAMLGMLNSNNRWSALGSFVETLMRSGR